MSMATYLGRPPAASAASSSETVLEAAPLPSSTTSVSLRPPADSTMALARAQQVGRAGPRAASQHAMGAEPGNRVPLVRIGAEPGVRQEPARGPFPHTGRLDARRLELVLGGKPRAAPAGVGIGLVPGEAGHRRVALLLRKTERRAHVVALEP